MIKVAVWDTTLQCTLVSILSLPQERFDRCTAPAVPLAASDRPGRLAVNQAAAYDNLSSAAVRAVLTGVPVVADAPIRGQHLY